MTTAANIFSIKILPNIEREIKVLNVYEINFLQIVTFTFSEIRIVKYKLYSVNCCGIHHVISPGNVKFRGSKKKFMFVF